MTIYDIKVKNRNDKEVSLNVPIILPLINFQK